MSKLLLPLLCIGLAGWLFGGSIWFGNQYTNGTQASWTLKDGTNQFHSPTLFSFQTSDAEVILDDNQLAMISDISQYLLDHQDRIIVLTGLYSKKETNNSDYENIGHARAESLRYLMYRQGVKLERLVIQSKLVKKHQLNSNGLINGGVEFSFSESPLAKYGDFTLEKEVLFDTKSATEINTPQFDQYVAMMRQYLTDHPDKKIKLTGFSNAVSQNTLTRKRVYTIEKMLKDSGISSDRFSSFLAETDRSKKHSYVEMRIY